ncbi:hypothetical protein GH733_019191, partial [Mirounga leonina]
MVKLLEVYQMQETYNPEDCILPAAKQPGEKTLQKEEPPTEDLDIEPGQEREEGACGVQELELKAESQEKGLEKTGGELGGGPDVKGKTPPNVTLAKIQEA